MFSPPASHLIHSVEFLVVGSSLAMLFPAGCLMEHSLDYMPIFIQEYICVQSVSYVLNIFALFFLTFPIECPHSGISMLHCMWVPPCDMASTLSRKPIFLVLSHSGCCHSVWNCLGPGNLLLKESSPFHFVPRTVSARESQQVLKLSWF